MTTPTIQFTVIGTPVPQGSSRGFWVKKKGAPQGHIAITSDNKKLKPWRQEVSGTAIAVMATSGVQIIRRPVAISINADFYFDRPNSQKKARYKTTKPDLDKLARSLFDSLTGVVFEDDSQVVMCSISKFYGEPARVDVCVFNLEAQR